MMTALPSRRAGTLMACTWLVALAAATFTTPADAQWRWRDASGRVTASDRPPPKEIPEKDILARPASAQRRAGAVVAPVAPVADAASAAAASPAASGAASAPAGVLAASAPGGLQAEVEARRKRAEQEQAVRAKAEEQKLAAQRAENCRRARAHVVALETGQRMARINEKGEREVLDDRARADEMRSARAVIASDCR
ncbi:MAG: DUF4124 domain-containing protein [Betaproteobacteria bacterium]|nr:DUF4124 domain-containing protein [Betaproteobacteria bacterium]MCC6247771.1 DUF4124 domain-containing protein [Rubrivivax sp.]MCL4696432.1 DUF4124 domain-containing protein [Burkholderiaceae bacterium]